MNKILIIITLVFITLTSFSQTKWTFEDCISYAYKNNIDLKQRELGVRIAEINNKRYKLDRLPSLNGETSHSFNYGRNISYSDNTYVNENTQNTNFSVSTGVVLFNGFKKSNIVKKSAIDLSAEIKDVETIKADIAVRLSGAYLDVLYSMEILLVANQQYKISQQQYEKSQKLVDAGKFPKGELLKQKALVVQDEVAVIEAQNAVDLAYVSLYNLLDIGNDQAFKIHEPIDIVVDANKSLMTAKYYYDKAVGERPEIEAANLRLMSSEKNLEIAKGGRFPTLSMGAGWSTYYADNISDLITKKTINFSDQLKNHERKYFGFRLDIPIFNGWNISSSVKNSRYEIEYARLDLQKSKNIIRQEIQEAYAKAMAAMKKYYANIIAVESNEEAFRYSQEKYNLGMIDIVSYNETKKEYIIAKSKFLQAKYDYIFRTKILDFYCGIPITL